MNNKNVFDKFLDSVDVEGTIGLMLLSTIAGLGFVMWLVRSFA